MNRLRVRAEALDHHRRLAGIADTQTEFARHLGISHATLSRVLSGKAEPGPRFIEAVLGAFPDATWDELFEFVQQDCCKPLSPSLPAG